jgi:adenosylhomocysteine nucleosidase
MSSRPGTVMTRIHSLVAALVLVGGVTAGDHPKPIGVLGAMPIEVEELRRQTTDVKERTVRGVRFVTGTLAGRKVVLARSGIGGVNAGVATALLLEHFDPSAVLFTGVAGGLNPDLGPLDIVIGRETAYHDFGEAGVGGFRPFPSVNPADGEPNPISFPADPVLLIAAEKAAKVLDLAKTTARQPRIVTGVIVTGNQFVASPARRDELRKGFKADAAEMEGAAVAQVCWQSRVPCLVVRSLSDDAGDKAPAAYKAFEKAAADNSARLVVGILGELARK